VRAVDVVHLLNQRRLRVSEQVSLEHANLAVGHPYRAERGGVVKSFAKEHFASLLAVTEAGAQIRRCGSAALDLAYVAAGRY